MNEDSVQIALDKTYPQKVIESLPGTFYVFDPNGSMILWNSRLEKITGFSNVEIGKMNALQFFDPSIHKDISKTIAKAFNGGDGEIEADIICKDGRRVPYFFRGISAEFDGKSYIVGVGFDISEKVKAEQEVRKLNELREKFIEVVSHQLRTPLNAIRWNLELLLESANSDQKEQVHEMLTLDTNVIERIGDMLSVLDIQKGEVRLKKKNGALRSVFIDVLDEFEDIASNKNIELKQSISNAPVQLFDFDHERIGFCMKRMIQNALTYTKQRGRVTTGVKKRGSTFTFFVEDNGIGIPKKDKENIFRPFFRASNAAQMMPDSSGVSLALVKFYVEQHGGSIGFESEYRKGSKFWFSLPVK